MLRVSEALTGLGFRCLRRLSVAICLLPSVVFAAILEDARPPKLMVYDSVADMPLLLDEVPDSNWQFPKLRSKHWLMPWLMRGFLER